IYESRFLLENDIIDRGQRDRPNARRAGHYPGPGAEHCGEERTAGRSAAFVAYAGAVAPTIRGCAARAGPTADRAHAAGPSRGGNQPKPAAEPAKRSPSGSIGEAKSRSSAKHPQTAEPR